VKTSVLLGILFLAAFIAVMVYSTFHMDRARCEVCITYQGRSACRTAAARTRELARRTATENACAQIASGITDSNQCENTPPDAVRWLSR
jgi:hypothetical protein